MKTRLDFVTNSSSSSFIIAKRHLSEDQIDAIRMADEVAEEMEMDNYRWAYEWAIKENDHYISGFAGMDNFSMGDFLSMIGVPEQCVEWDEYEIPLPEENEVPEEKDNDRWLTVLNKLRGEEDF